MAQVNDLETPDTSHMIRIFLMRTCSIIYHYHSQISDLNKKQDCLSPLLASLLIQKLQATINIAKLWLESSFTDILIQSRIPSQRSLQLFKNLLYQTYGFK